MDASTRRLRYFVAVAEELHFTRAARRLFIAQQSLSKQILELENQLGVPLFQRNRRSVNLTPAGLVLLERVQPLLLDFDAAVDAARHSGNAELERLRVGFGMFAALELTSLILAEFGRLRPNVEVQMREYSLLDQTAGLAEGWADVAFIRPPLAEPGLVIEPLFVEPRVISVARSHPLAQLSDVDVLDVLDLTLSVGMSTDDEYLRFWSLDDYRESREAPAPRRTTSNTEELQLVASGLACTVNPAAVARYLPQAEVVCVPIRDVPGSVLALAWRMRHHNVLVETFAAAARAVVAREIEIVRAIEHPFADGPSRREGDDVNGAVTDGS